MDKYEKKTKKKTKKSKKIGFYNINTPKLKKP